MNKKGTPDSGRSAAEQVADLLPRHAGVVRRLVERQMRGFTRQNIEDVTQEVHLRLVRLLPGYTVGNFEGFVWQVAANAIKEFAAKHSRDRKRVTFDSTLAEAISEQGVDDRGDPLTLLEAQETQQDVQQIVQSLAPHLQTVLLLHERDDLSFEEIGRRMGRTAKTVKRYYEQALARCMTRANRR